jgi:murein DD-endopeptidase MepM/ murein hydrolase activator NlpD
MRLAFILICLLFLKHAEVKNSTCFPLKPASPDCISEPKNTAISTYDSLLFYARKFDQLNSRIRDLKLEKAKARQQVTQLLSLLKRYYFQQKNIKLSVKKHFPVQGYSAKAIGGKNGSGYLPKGYNYYDGNNHKGHPAHDIFIQDQNQDCLDDRTRKPVNIISVSDGIVIATESGWKSGSKLRGGNYVWVYYPQEELLYYFAHNQTLFVKPGDLVRSGQILATMGKTGVNASKKRSPTHLHFMTLQVKQNGNLPPSDPYQVLVKL